MSVLPPQHEHRRRRQPRGQQAQAPGVERRGVDGRALSEALGGADAAVDRQAFEAVDRLSRGVLERHRHRGLAGLRADPEELARLAAGPAAGAEVVQPVEGAVAVEVEAAVLERDRAERADGDGLAVRGVDDHEVVLAVPAEPVEREEVPGQAGDLGPLVPDPGRGPGRRVQQEEAQRVLRRVRGHEEAAVARKGEAGVGDVQPEAAHGRAGAGLDVAGDEPVLDVVHAVELLAAGIEGQPLDAVVPGRAAHRGGHARGEVDAVELLAAVGLHGIAGPHRGPGRGGGQDQDREGESGLHDERARLL